MCGRIRVKRLGTALFLLYNKHRQVILLPVGDDCINAKVSAAYASGHHHTYTGAPCQDRAAGFLRAELAGVVLCDGAGSCPHSERAAQRLTEWLPDYLEQHFADLHSMSRDDAAADLVAAGQKELSTLGMPPEECWCTLLFYAAHADGRWICGHIGDGYIFRMRQDTAVLFSEPENGQASWETYFLSAPDAARHLRIRCGTLTEPYAVLLTSDGGGDTLYDRQNEKPASAVEQLCDWLMNPENDAETVTQALGRVVREKMTDGTDDDVSVAMASFGSTEEPASDDAGEDNMTR